MHLFLQVGRVVFIKCPAEKDKKQPHSYKDCTPFTNIVSLLGSLYKMHILFLELRHSGPPKSKIELTGPGN